MAVCSWYINDDIVDINIFRSSLEETFQPIANAPMWHVLSRRAQLGDDWPRKHIDQLVVFNVFENKDFKSQYQGLAPGNSGNSDGILVASCHRIAKPTFLTYADPRTYNCTDQFCPSTTANIVELLTENLGPHPEPEMRGCVCWMLNTSAARDQLHAAVELYHHRF